MPKGEGQLRDLSGQTFGRWTVVRFERYGAFRPVPPSRRGRAKQGDRPAYWRCRCECGTEKEVDGLLLRAGRSTQCHACKLRADHEAGRLVAHTARLTKPVWDRVCKTCGKTFVGTARQQYCGKACRPKPKKKRVTMTHPCG